MRIRFFNTYEPVTSFYRDLLPWLGQQAIQVEVFVSAAEYRAGRGSLAQALRDTSTRIKYLPSLGVRPEGRGRKAWLMLQYAISSGLVSLLSDRVEVNFFLTQPPFFSAWGWVLKLLRQQRYICLLMDIYPDVAIRYGLLKAGTLPARLLSRLTRFAWRHADAVVVIGRCMREQLIAEGVPAERIHVIPNWANARALHPIPRAENRLRHALRLDQAFVVLYSGNMGVAHDFATLLDAAERLLPFPKIRFLLVGDGERRGEVEGQIHARGLSNVAMLPFQPIDRLSESLSLGDVHLVTLREGFEGLVVPSKAYAAQAVGKPLIYVGNPAGEIARMVTESKTGTVIPIGSADALADAILKYHRNPALGRAQGKRALAAHRMKYSARNSLLAYQRLFSGMRLAHVAD